MKAQKGAREQSKLRPALNSNESPVKFQITPSVCFADSSPGGGAVSQCSFHQPNSASAQAALTLRVTT